MRNTIILTGILFVGVVLASVYYFAGLDRDEQAKSKLYEQLPDDAVWIAAFQDNELIDKVFDGFPIFKSILGDEAIRQLDRIRHDLLATGTVAPASAEPDILLSVHPVGQDSLGYLLSMQLSRGTHTENLFKAIHSGPADYQVAWADTAGHRYFALSVAGFSRPLFVTVADGITMASPSLALIERIASQAYTRLPARPIDYFVENSTENSLVKLHVVQHNLGPLARHLTAGRPGVYLSLLDSLGGQASLHLNYKSDALIFSGFSELNAPDHYLALYSTQSPVAQQAKHLFPANTASYLSFGISDFERFHQGNLALLEQEGRLAQMRDQHRIILDRTGISIQDDLLPQWDDEFALVELATRENLAVVKLRDTAAFFQVAQALSTPYPDSIYRFNHSNLLHYSFGEVVQSFARPYFMVMGDYLVCANHTSTLFQVAQDVSSGITLSSTPGYRAFDELQGNSSNVTFFGHVENASRIISGKLKPAFQKLYNDTARFGYADFYAWSIQLSGNGGNFFTNLYAQYIDQGSPGASPTWTFDLNGRLAAPPGVFAYDDTSQFILAQSSNHILHAIDFNGKRLWNAQLPGIILGAPRQLADSSIVLATESRLYRFDTRGDASPGFSLELPQPAVATQLVAERDSLIRIFVPAQDALLVYDDRGQPVPEWENIALEGKVVATVAANDDTVAIVLATDAGQLYFLDINGQTLRQHALHAGLGNGLAAMHHPEGTMAVAADTLGNLHAYPLNGESATWQTASATGMRRLDAVDIAGDALPEVVGLEPRSVATYAYPDSAYLFRYELGQDIDLDRVRFFEISQNHYGIGLPTPANGLVYLLRGDGTLLEGFPREGGPYFYYGRAARGKPAFFLTSKNDRKLYFFQW